MVDEKGRLVISDFPLCEKQYPIICIYARNKCSERKVTFKNCRSFLKRSEMLSCSGVLTVSVT